MKPHSNCAALVAVIEELLAHRRADRRNRRSERHYTREDLTRQAYHGYHDMVYGRIKRPPERPVILQIADYFRASALGRDRLLVAAGYGPVLRMPDHRTEVGLLRHVSDLLVNWPYPALALTHDWTIADWNVRCLAAWNVTEDAWARLPMSRRNVLGLVFDPSLPVFRYLTPPARQALGLRCLRLFWQSNLLSQPEAWIAERLKPLSALPGFDACRAQLNFRESDSATDDAHRLGVLSLPILRHGQTGRLRAVATPVHVSGYPAIVSFLS